MSLLKFLFRTIITIFFLILLIAGITLFREGDDFRWMGKTIQSAGVTLENFGQKADSAKKGMDKFLKFINFFVQEEDKDELQEKKEPQKTDEPPMDDKHMQKLPGSPNRKDVKLPSVRLPGNIYVNNPCPWRTNLT